MDAATHVQERVPVVRVVAEDVEVLVQVAVLVVREVVLDVQARVLATAIRVVARAVLVIARPNARIVALLRAELRAMLLALIHASELA